MLTEKLRDKIYPWYPVRATDSIADILLYEYQNYPDRVAFSYRNPDKSITDVKIRDFYESVQALAAHLERAHRREGQHIALIGENSYHWLVAFFAIILAGHVAVPIDKDLSVSQIDTLLKNSDTKLAFFSSKYKPDLVQIRRLKVTKLEDVPTLVEQHRGQIPTRKPHKNTCAVIFFTSGTTGPNKGVMLSQKNIASDCYFASQNFKPAEHGTTVAFLPWHHSFGLVTAVLMPFYYHLPILINSSLKNIMQDFHDYHPQTIFAVPQVVELFYRQIWRTARGTNQDKKLKFGISLSNQLKALGLDARKKFFASLHEQFGGELEIIICGGAYLDRRYVKWFRSIGVDVLVGYGITECSPVLAVNRNKYARDGSVGLPVHGCEISIIDGEVCARGHNVMLGYYKDKKATRGVLQKGWFHTGDLGYLDHNGFLFLTGRKKNLIILNNGENISPEVIEAYFLHDRAVAECIAYSSGNRIIMSVYPEEEYLGDQDYFDNLMYNYNSTVPKNHQIAMVKLRTEEFPKNNSRKILRDAVEKEP